MTVSAPRIAFLHTGAVVIAPVMALASDLLPGATTVNYLDDKIVADLGDPARADSVPERLTDLVKAARSAGADAVMLTCSSISHYAAPMSAELGIPVLRIDEAMADEAVATGPRIAVLATLATTLRPTLALIAERAELAGADPELTSEVVDGAFAAVSSGDRATHDRLVAAAIERVAAGADVVVLAQASMASAADAAHVAVPVLTSLKPGITRLSEFVAAR
ncbi:aspartate/glutamate racemase family protein [Microbacterium rhizomatis]|uniref:Aspartate/glutamate racemase family protein n=1 Tax=Microbacterium rhizomatis TaxID=1631477 RepID=A0A5J5J0H4_9MICO|nr:aspartate/glutamate racemase family protein [Microbacterium rhizomatis]KAA9108142.1 aspartate/glutamate racemase family protein [Microbacterium rhizomatis]